MNEKTLKILVPILGAIGFLGYLTFFTVNEIQQAIILQFGDPKRVIQKAGLNYKIPFIQNVVLLDKRILNLDAPSEEVIASDQKRLIVDAFARFKIKDPLKFYISVGNERVARSRLSTIINSRIRGVLGKEELATLVSKERARLMDKITQDVNSEASKLGIEIIDVRIKRADLPQANSEAVYRRMQTERLREAKEFRAEGAEIAQTVKSTADKEVTIILAEANKKSQILKGEGDGQRNKIFANAFGKDPSFFSFYRSMQSYEKSLVGKDTSLILSPDSDFFKYFGKSGARNAPRPAAPKKQ
jgi:membrane protease subunit HflC